MPKLSVVVLNELYLLLTGILTVLLSSWCNRLSRFIASDDGPTAVEYAVLLALIVVACIGAVGAMSAATGSSFDRSSQAINQALSG